MASQRIDAMAEAGTQLPDVCVWTRALRSTQSDAEPRKRLTCDRDNRRLRGDRRRTSPGHAHPPIVPDAWIPYPRSSTTAPTFHGD